MIQVLSSIPFLPSIETRLRSLSPTFIELGKKKTGAISGGIVIPLCNQLCSLSEILLLQVKEVDKNEHIFNL